MGTFDARGSGDMPVLIRAVDAGVASPSARPLPDEPLTPRTASSSLPFLISSSSTPSPQTPSSPRIRPHDTCTCQTPSPPLAPYADCIQLPSSFYFSSSASRSSGAFSLSSDPGSLGDDDSYSIIMPGQTFEAQAEHRFQSPNTADYFPLTCTATNTSIDDTTQPPPCSAGSGKSARTASPMTFARWARRQHDGEPANKLKRRDHGSRNGLSRSGSIQKRQTQTGGAPQMTREEFEALPLAIQRKVC